MASLSHSVGQHRTAVRPCAATFAPGTHPARRPPRRGLAAYSRVKMPSSARHLIVFAVAVGALLAAAPAGAVPPSLSTVGVQNRHPTATFNAPKAGSVTIYVASKPDRATDGQFLTENVVEIGPLTDAEIQAGQWKDASQLDPGSYFVLLRADPNFGACYISGSDAYDPSCADGFSAVVPLTVPMPAIKYTAFARTYRYLSLVDLGLMATPLGMYQPYKVCYQLKSKARRCLSGELTGYNWNSSTSDQLSVKTTLLGATTTFTWFVGGAKVAVRRSACDSSPSSAFSWEPR